MGSLSREGLPNIQNVVPKIGWSHTEKFWPGKTGGLSQGWPLTGGVHTTEMINILHARWAELRVDISLLCQQTLPFFVTFQYTLYSQSIISFHFLFHVKHLNMGGNLQLFPANGYKCGSFTLRYIVAIDASLNWNWTIQVHWDLLLYFNYLFINNPWQMFRHGLVATQLCHSSLASYNFSSSQTSLIQLSQSY